MGGLFLFLFIFAFVFAFVFLWQYQLLARVQNNWNSYTLVVEIQNNKATVANTAVSFFKKNKVKHRTTIRPNDPGAKFLFLLGKNLSSHKNPYIYITFLLMITKSWKQPRCFSTGEWINTMPMVQQYNGILLNNEKELLIHATWMNLKYIWLNGRSQM